MLKITYKTKSGAYKSKIIEEHELPEIERKMLESRNKIIYWWKEHVYETLKQAGASYIQPIKGKTKNSERDNLLWEHELSFIEDKRFESEGD